jgi:hypothetical protein
MNNVKKLFLASLALFSAASPLSALAENHVWKKNEEAVKLFDIFLRSNPVTLYRIQKSSMAIKATHAAIKNATKTNQAQEAAFVKSQLDKSLELVKPFIDDIHGFKDIIIPLINDSQIAHGVKKNYLTKFLNGADKLEVFTDREIKTVEQLENLLHEIQGFFSDLFASLSQETKDSYKAFIGKNSKK